MATNFLHILPPEVVFNIASLVDPRDYLPFKLTCKAIAAHMPRSLATIVRDVEMQPVTYYSYQDGDEAHMNYLDDLLDAIEADHNVENWALMPYEKFVRARTTQILHELEHWLRRDAPRACRKALLCTIGGHFKPLSCFLDPQRMPVDYLPKTSRLQKGHRHHRVCMDCNASWQTAPSFRQGGKILFQCPVCQVKLPVAKKHNVNPRPPGWPFIKLTWGENDVVCSSCAGPEADAPRFITGYENGKVTAQQLSDSSGDVVRMSKESEMNKEWWLIAEVECDQQRD